MDSKLWVLIEDKLNTKHLMFTIILGFIAMIANAFPIPLVANLQLILGNVAVIIVTILLGPWYGLIAAALGSLSLIFSHNGAHALLVYSAEAIWLGFAVRYGLYALYANFFYWLIAGTPLFYIWAKLFYDLPDSSLPFIFLKHMINGLIYTCIGSIVIIMTSRFWNQYRITQDRKRRRFSEQLTYVFTIIVTLSLLVSALVFNHNSVQDRQVLLQKHIHDMTIQQGKATENFLKQNQTAIEHAAHWLGRVIDSPAEQQTILKRLSQHYPNFTTLNIANKHGDITHSILQSKNAEDTQDMAIQGTEKDVINVKDSPYFQQALHQNKKYTSPAFEGIGTHPKAMIAISSPVHTPTQPDVPVAVLQGSLELSNFTGFANNQAFEIAQYVLLVDDNQRVIYASAPLALPTLSSFQYSKMSNQIYRTDMNLMNLHDLSNSSPEYIYSKYQMNNGWNLYVLESFAPIIRSVEAQFKITFAFLLLSTIIAMFIAKTTSKRLTKPLELIANNFTQIKSNSNDVFLLDHFAPREVYKLFLRLKSSQAQLLKHKNELEQTVAQRTQELEDANIRLKDLAEKDSLTGLYNRRYAETRFETVQELCERSHEPITVALLDLDHFKRVNDTYGHLAGDECLKAVAQLLTKHFQRESDIVARYGGEEFLLILPLCNPAQTAEHLNAFRRDLADLEIKHPTEANHFHIKTSIGAFVAHASYSHLLEKWIKHSDTNLYQAKTNGRNQVLISYEEALTYPNQQQI